jgi:hypothetical protein
MKKVNYLWAAAHEMTPEQEESLKKTGTVTKLQEMNNTLHNELCNLKLDSLLAVNARELLRQSEGYTLIQPAGSPAFQFQLGIENQKEKSASKKVKIQYAFSKRVSRDIPQPDGSIRKIAIFTHEGWVKV